MVQEAKGRIYLFENARFPSVTTIIQAFFPFWEGSNRDEAQAAAELGSAVHLMVGELLHNLRFASKRISSFPNALHGYGYSWLKFMEAFDIKPMAYERPLFSPKYRFAGRPDFIALVDGTPTIIDWTIGSTRLAKRLQTAAYEIAWKEMTKDRHKYDRIEVPLKSNGKMPTLRPHENANDKYAFLNTVNLYRWREAA